MSNKKDNPTVFHITHWKAGSQWIYVVLRELFPDQIVHPLTRVAHVRDNPIQTGMIYPTVYLNKKQFSSVKIPHDSKFFFVIRDLRDTLVSRYFSLLKSHPLESQTGKHTRVIAERPVLEKLNLSEGLKHTMNLMEATVKIQLDWYNSADLIIRYEDMLRDELGVFKTIIDFSERRIDEKEFERVVKANSFSNITGRSRGDEDVTSHHRKGIAGDWQNYFDDDLKQEFKERFGSVLTATGYETTNDW